MHLVVSHAASQSEAGRQALQSLQLPVLDRLLTQMQGGAVTGSDEHSLNLPSEQVMAQLLGWPALDGLLPLAARQAYGDGFEVLPHDRPWGLLTPSHWELGREQIVLTDPQGLGLDETESRDLWQAVSDLFDRDGWSLHWGAPLRWYVRHDSLAGVATASPDRVVGQPIDAWLPDRLAGAPLRRLQAEAQMLLYTHPLNAAREARGAMPVNAFWISGTGPTQPSLTLAAEVVFDDSLRAPLLAQDWAAWVQSWQRLDATHMAELQACAASGKSASLTLCGERHAQRFDAAPQGAWRRLARYWARADVSALLQAL